MDFFAAQEAAKKRTAAAVVLFVLGVAATALAVYWVAVWSLFFVSPQLFFGSREVVNSSEFGIYPFLFIKERPEFFWTAISAVVAVILTASAYKISTLGAGGLAVAESVGARIVDLNTTDEKERRLLNVVEEMSIASGVPVPMVGVMDNEPNVNAFAAMKTPHDAVVVVTRGALDTFNREELQAVVGHEFSHLLNGDSKMNVTLAGWVWGLFSLTIVGRMLMRSRGNNSGRNKGAGAIVLIGLAIFVVGLIGHLFGQIIQALISRQREFLADASAVQFTRNPGGMLNALSKLRAGTSVRHPGGSGLAHFFFGPAHAFNGFTGLLATHPPLNTRMKAIDTNYESYLMPEVALAEVSAAPEPPAAPKAVPFHPMTLVGILAAAGTPAVTPEIKNTREAWSENVKTALTTPEGAQAILLSLVLPQTNRTEAIKLLQERVPGNIFRQVYELEAAPVDIKERFALALLAVERLRSLDTMQKITFLQALEALVDVDGQLSGFEMMMAEWLKHVLKAQPEARRFPPEEAASRVLSYLQARQKGAAAMSEEVLNRVLSGLVLKDLRAIPNVTTHALREALPALRGYNFLQRREFLIAVGRVLHLDHELSDEETETLRLLAGILDCPLPTRLVSQAV